MMNSAIEQLARSVLDEAELVILVPVPRHAARDANPTVQLDRPEVRIAPDPDLFTQPVTCSAPKHESIVNAGWIGVPGPGDRVPG